MVQVIVFLLVKVIKRLWFESRVYISEFNEINNCWFFGMIVTYGYVCTFYIMRFTESQQ